MNKKIRIIVSIICLISFFSLAPAYSTKGKAIKPIKKGLRIGVTLLTKQHIFYLDLEKGFKEAAKKYGIKLLIQSSEFSNETQTAQVEDFIVSKVDAIIVCPADSKGVGGAIKQANKAGIPVFTADIAAKEGRVVCHIASDNQKAGEMLGDYLAKKLLKGKGKVAIIDHPIVTSVQDRVRGFLKALKKYPKIKVVARQPADGQKDKAMSVMETILQAHPKLDAVFGINDDSALGALAAVEAAGRKDIVIVGYDAIPEARKAILKGSALKADAVQHPREMGRTTIETVVKYFRGQEVPKYIPIKVGIVDRKSLAKEK